MVRAVVVFAVLAMLAVIMLTTSVFAVSRMAFLVLRGWLSRRVVGVLMFSVRGRGMAAPLVGGGRRSVRSFTFVTGRIPGQRILRIHISPLLSGNV